MDNNNWTPVQGSESSIDPSNWRDTLQPDSRQRIINKIMETLKKHLPFSGQDGLHELRKIAVRFEEKIYNAATSQSDYLRKISLKMLSMETKSQTTIANSVGNGNGNRAPDPVASLGLPSQIQNQGQSIPMPLAANPTQRQQLLSHNIQNAAGVQSSSTISSALPSVSNLTQTSIPSAVGQNSNMHNMSGTSQNSGGNSMGQGLSSNMFANSQRQIQGRQQAVSQQQQLQSQNNQQYLYQQHMQHQLLNPKFQQGNIPQSMMQTHIQQQQQPQQQNLLQPTQLQSSPQAVMPASSLSNLQQNHQSSVQQTTKSMLQQHPQSVLRQPQPAAVVHQQQTTVPQQSMMLSQQQQQQQQQIMGQQSNAANMQQNHLIGPQNNVGDMQQQQQQRLLGQQNNLSNLPQQQQQHLVTQQNNLSNMHQQQLGPQSNVTGLQQQLLGTQASNSSMQNNQHSVHMLQQSKAPSQQQSLHNASSLLPTQGQQPQPQPSQQLLSQIQSQSTQMQHQPNQLQRDVQQRLVAPGQASSPLLQQQNVSDQQKQLFQSQRAIQETSSTSLDSTAQTGNANGGDWQEEIYQKMKVMREMYLPDLNDVYQRIAAKLREHDSVPGQPKTEQLEKLRAFKAIMERIIHFLQVPKINIVPGFKERLDTCENQIKNFINTNRPRKPGSMQQGQLPPSHMHSMQQPASQINQVQSHENQVNSQLQSVNPQGSLATMQQNNMTSLQQSSTSSLSGVSATQQNMMNSLQSSPNMDLAHGLNSVQQVAVGSMQQNPVCAPQQANMSSMSSQNGVNVLQPNMSSLQSTSGMLQHHLKHQPEHQMMNSQQLKQLQQQRMMMHKLQQQQQHQQHQQQQLPQQAKQQLPAQLQTNQHQMSQLHQSNDASDLKVRPSMGVRPGVFQQHLSAGQRSALSQQQLKPGSPFPMSSNQLLQATSPQILQHSSPQVDQSNLLTSLTKAGTPLQSANSPFVVPSPSTPLAPSPMPGDSEKPASGISSLSNAANVGHQQTSSVVAPAQSLAIGTPGISASPLLAECIGPDGVHGNSLASVSGKSNTTENPLERLIKAVKSMSPKALSASVSDIGSVVSMTDRIAGSAPGNGSRAAVGEDLVAMTKCRLQAKNFMTQDGTNGTRKMRRYTSAMPLNVVSSAGSRNDSFKNLNGSEASDLESTATSGIKRPRMEANHALVEEIKEINQRLIDTVLEISNQDVNPSVAAGPVGGEGTIVKCSFSAVALSPNLKSQYASAQMSPIQPLRLLVPTNYPNCSPILLDKFPVEVSKEYEDLSVKAKSKFSISLRNLSQPMSLGEIARTWDVCARAVISEYAQQSGGGSFSSKYGTWEHCLSAA